MMFILFLLTCNTLQANYVAKYATIFASSNLKFVLPAIIQRFYKKYPNTSVHVQYGASGYLAQAILDGNRWDIFLSADMKYPQKVYNLHKSTIPAKAYVQGKLSLIVPKEEATNHASISLLKQNVIKKIAIANRSKAPYGKASFEVLKKSALYDSIRSKIIVTPDVATVINNVIWYKDAGFIPSSALPFIQARHYKQKIKQIKIDQKLYASIIQGYTLSKSASSNQNAKKFLQFLHTKEVKKLFQQYGYIPLL